MVVRAGSTGLAGQDLPFEIYLIIKCKQTPIGWLLSGFFPMVKWIVLSMISVVEEAIGKIRFVTNEARKIAKRYEEHPGEIYLHDETRHLRNVEWLSF